MISTTYDFYSCLYPQRFSRTPQYSICDFSRISIYPDDYITNAIIRCLDSIREHLAMTPYSQFNDLLAKGREIMMVHFKHASEENITSCLIPDPTNISDVIFYSDLIYKERIAYNSKHTSSMLKRWGHSYKKLYEYLKEQGLEGTNEYEECIQQFNIILKELQSMKH